MGSGHSKSTKRDDQQIKLDALKDTLKNVDEWFKAIDEKTLSKNYQQSLRKWNSVKNVCSEAFVTEREYRGQMALWNRIL